jgi:hypothetical protein
MLSRKEDVKGSDGKGEQHEWLEAARSVGVKHIEQRLPPAAGSHGN